MRGFFVLSLPLLASAAAIRNEPNILNARQLTLQSMMEPAIRPFSVKKLTPQWDSKATREHVLYGPFKLPPKKNSSEAGLNVLKLDQTSEAFSKMIAGFCTDCIVLSAETKTTDRDGKRIGVTQGIYTHHTIVTDIGKTQYLNAAMVKCDGKIDFFGGFDSLNLINMGGGGGMGGGGMSAEGSAGGHSHGNMGSTSSPMASADQASNPLASLYKGVSAATLALAGGGLLTLAGTAVSALAGVMIATNSKLPGGATVFIAVGAEGTENIFTANSTQVKSGFYVQKQDKMHLSAEVINYDSFAKEIYLSIEYEYILGQQPGYLDVSLGAINVDGCARSATEAMVPPKDKAKIFSSPEWIVIADGYLIKVIPHLHDGATTAKIYLNNKLVCESKAIYGGESAALDGKRWQTITAYEDCKDPIKISVGDKLTMSAEYDLTKYRLRPSSADHSKEAEAMGLALIWHARELPPKKQ